MQIESIDCLCQFEHSPSKIRLFERLELGYATPKRCPGYRAAKKLRCEMHEAYVGRERAKDDQ
jgi:hypothetical protein